jgi:hypothetical protein
MKAVYFLDDRKLEVREGPTRLLWRGRWSSKSRLAGPRNHLVLPGFAHSRFLASFPDGGR